MGLRCFVAIAVGHQDTDKVYDALIAPTLRGMGISPRRIDRIEHNEDIDDKIIAEIQECDLCVADLTYARPSVYFEAGFAGRAVPVIYTCRKDHLKPKSNDEFGNFRVHFDLQMKNIIPWTSTSDREFVKRLARRVALVTRPLLRAKEMEQIEKAEAEKFAVLSVHEKMRLINEACRLQVQDGRYRLLRNRSGALHGRKVFDGTIYGVTIYVGANMTPKELSFLYKNFYGVDGILDGIDKEVDPKDIGALREHLFFCSLQRVPIKRMMTYLPQFRLGRQRNEIVWEPEKEIVTGFRNRRWGDTHWSLGTKKIPRQVHIHILDSITSLTSLRKTLSAILNEIEAPPAK